MTKSGKFASMLAMLLACALAAGEAPARGGGGGHGGSRGGKSGSHHSGNHHHHFFAGSSVFYGGYWPGYRPGYSLGGGYVAAPGYAPAAALYYVDRNEVERQCDTTRFDCQGEAAYLPYVRQCPGGWVRVAPFNQP